MNESTAAVKRNVSIEEKKGLQNTRNLILVGVMMAVGIVLRLFAGVIALGSMHPNFLIATYCLSIYIVRPNLREAAAIGLISGAISQIGTSMAWLGLGSETLGAVIFPSPCPTADLWGSSAPAARAKPP